jgi:hypothetical protein
MFTRLVLSLAFVLFQEKKILEEENEKLASLIQQTTAQNEKLSSELEIYIHKSQDYRDKVTEMETLLEKSAIKNATYQANLEKLEQEMARMKLKHKLEVKVSFAIHNLILTLGNFMYSDIPEHSLGSVLHTS